MWVQAVVTSNATGNSVQVSAPSEVAIDAILGAVKRHLVAAIPNSPTTYPLADITISQIVAWE